jgi:hypothetical protein
MAWRSTGDQIAVSHTGVDECWYLPKRRWPWVVGFMEIRLVKINNLNSINYYHLAVWKMNVIKGKSCYVHPYYAWLWFTRPGLKIKNSTCDVQNFPSLGTWQPLWIIAWSSQWMLHRIQGADIHSPVYLNSEMIHCFNSTHRAKVDDKFYCSSLWNHHVKIGVWKIYAILKTKVPTNSIAVHYGTTMSKLGCGKFMPFWKPKSQQILLPPVHYGTARSKLWRGKFTLILKTKSELKKKEGGVTRMWPPNYQLILHPWHEKVCGVIKLTWPEPGLPRGPSIKILFLSIIWCRTCIVPKYICMHSHSPIMDIGQFIQRSISNQTSYLKCAEYVNIKSLLNTSRISQIGKEMSVHAPQ